MDTFQVYAFPPFSLIGRVLKKVKTEQATLLLVTPAWQTQAWYPKVLQMSVRHPILLLPMKKLLLGPNNGKHPLVENKSLRLVVWTVSGVNLQQKSYLKKLLPSSQVPEEKVQSLITNWPGESGIAGVIAEKLIPFEIFKGHFTLFNRMF